MTRWPPGSVELDVAPGVHRITQAFTNCYLVTDLGGDDGVTLVDAAFRGTWPLVRDALRRLGRSPADLRALVLTHGHFDHVGFAEPLVHWTGLPVFVHPADRALARRPYAYRSERSRIAFPARHPASWPVLAAMIAAGALRSRGVEAGDDLVDGHTVRLPGGPRIIHTPGHTAGQCVLHLPDRGVVISGDALVTLDPYTGRVGPRLVAPAATQDVRLARRSLERVGRLEADLVLPGHGEPWRQGAARAAALAASNG